MEQLRTELMQTLGTYLPSILGALAVLVVGWIIARIISNVVRKGLEKTTVDEKVGQWLSGDRSNDIDWGDGIAKVVFYVLLIVVLVGCFQVLGLTLMTEPMNGILARAAEFGTSALAAGVLILVAWVVASILRAVIGRGLGASKMDERLGQQLDESSVPISKSLSEAAYWLTFLLFAPAILGVLGLNGLLGPVQDLTQQLLGFLPKLLGASLIFLVGWFVARILQRVVTSLLSATGLDSAGEKAGFGKALGSRSLSSVAGVVVYALILVPVLIAALNALALDAITVPASDMLGRLLEAIPLLFAAALLMVISYVIARLVGGLVTNLLSGVGFDGVLQRLGLSSEKNFEGKRSPSDIAGFVVMVTVLLFATSEATALLGFESLSGVVSELTMFGGQVVFGILIFSAGLLLANVVATTIRASGTRQAGLLALLARIAILGVTGAMALRYIVPNSQVVDLAFSLLLGSVAVAAAIAFGWGGRDTARDLIQEWRGKVGP